MQFNNKRNYRTLTYMIELVSMIYCGRWLNRVLLIDA